MTPARFVARHYAQTPHSVPGGCRDLLPLVDLDGVGRILDRRPPDVMVAREGARWAGEGPVDAARGRALLAEGWTVAVFHAEGFDDGLAALARGFAEDLAAPIDVHVYATPAGRHGFRWHYDAEEVFLLQTVGRKRFGIRKNTVNPWPIEETLPKEMDFAAERSPLRMEVELHPGDWLYVPAGWWHVAEALEDSVTVAVGAMAPSAIAALDALREQLKRSVFWRQRLPVLGRAGGLDEAAARAALRHVLDGLAPALGEALKDERVLDALLASRPPSP